MPSSLPKKYLKAVFERQHLTVPGSHDLEYLCEQLQGTGLPVADIAEPAEVLTAYGVDARCPGFVTDENEAEHALVMMERMVRWAQQQLD